VISYLLPTRNRQAVLASTLEELGELSVHAHERVGGAEVIVIDNASEPPVELPAQLPNGMPVSLIRLEINAGAAARNAGAALAHGEWLVMLDDDSYPLDVNHLWVVTEVEDDVAAIGADIRLPEGGREDGGLPEVFVGCGAAVRREAFLAVEGYDPSFGFYAEEYDLCARLLLAGWRIVHDLRFRVMHQKVADGRDMGLVLRHLVRNNGWVMQRYAPRHRLAEEIEEVITRYGRIAKRENAMGGYLRGRRELATTIDEQSRQPMRQELFDVFTGLAHVRQTVARAPLLSEEARAAVVDEGKNGWAVHQALAEAGIEEVDERRADVLIVGTLSLGPMMDAWERRSGGIRPVVLPWMPENVPDRRYATVVLGH
jgi:GT2 family glycosyltransferase